MIIERLSIPDVLVCTPHVFEDERGYFFESFRSDQWQSILGVDVQFVQDNESKSNKGVLRGFHYQLPPFAQTKLVRVIKGAILDVVVDIRKNSPTFGQHLSQVLSEKNKKQLLVPKGFAHAFLVLEDESIVSYKVDQLYAPKFDRGIIFNDPSLAIDWGVETKELVLSKKDAALPLLKNAEIPVWD